MRNLLTSEKLSEKKNNEVSVILSDTRNSLKGYRVYKSDTKFRVNGFESLKLTLLVDISGGTSVNVKQR